MELFQEYNFDIHVLHCTEWPKCIELQNTQDENSNAIYRLKTESKSGPILKLSNFIHCYFNYFVKIPLYNLKTSKYIVNRILHLHSNHFPSLSGFLITIARLVTRLAQGLGGEIVVP